MQNITEKNDLLGWLNDAHAMEVSMVEVLTGHAMEARTQPWVETRINEHLQETRGHVVTLRTCIEMLGSKPSTAKPVWADLVGQVKGASTAVFDDVAVKNLLTEYSAEHFEIACYTSLIAAARELGEYKIADLLGPVLQQEEKTAKWLKEQIELVTLDYIRGRAKAAAAAVAASQTK